MRPFTIIVLLFSAIGAISTISSFKSKKEEDSKIIYTNEFKIIHGMTYMFTKASTSTGDSISIQVTNITKDSIQTEVMSHIHRIK